MTIEHASALRPRKTRVPTVAEIRAAAAKGVTLSTQSIREAATKKAKGLRSTVPATKEPSTSADPNVKLIAGLRSENFQLQRELKAARRNERTMLNRLQMVMGITAN
jgi:hypothetical protein